jgi:predicted solute-binding protein
MYENHLHSNSFNVTTSNDLKYIETTFNINTQKATQILCVQNLAFEFDFALCRMHEYFRKITYTYKKKSLNFFT